MRRLLLITALLTLPAPVAADAATRWVVKGGGWGHGLGMSQYGAYGQALEGRGYRKILRHYYTDTKLGQTSGTVRVLLQASVGSSSFSGATRVGSKNVRANRTYSVSRAGARIVVRTARGKRVARSRGVLRVLSSSGLVTVGGKGTYRDVIEYRPGASGGVTAVNKVELENYIRGVVPNESPASWPLEALKAQAVAARSYALGTGGGTSKIFDHYDTVASQVYGGYGSETSRTNRAVARTKGEVLRHDGEVIVAYFHSTSGGHTEHNENVWGGTPLPYIRGVKDPWDKRSPYHRWKVGYNAKRLGSALGVGRLKRVRVNKRGVSGRIVRATFRGSAGKNRVDGWSGLRGRLALRDIPSTFKRISARGSTARAGAAGMGSRAHARDVSGRVVPARAGSRVIVQRRARDGWRRVAGGRLDDSRRYRIAVGRPGQYRVVAGGDPGPVVRVR